MWKYKTNDKKDVWIDKNEELEEEKQIKSEKKSDFLRFASMRNYKVIDV